MEYASNRDKEQKGIELDMDGYVLLAPVSDREMAGLFVDGPSLEKSTRRAREMIDNGEGQEVMRKTEIPGIFQSPVTAYRWWSLAAKG